MDLLGGINTIENTERNNIGNHLYQQLTQNQQKIPEERMSDALTVSSQ